MSQPPPTGHSGSSAQWPDPGGGLHQPPLSPWLPGSPPSVPPPAGSGPPYGPPPPGFYPLPPPRHNGLAVTSLVVSIAGLVITACGTFCFFLLGLLGLPLGVTGAIIGHVAIRQTRDRGEAGRGMAIAGVALGWTAATLALLVLVAMILLLSSSMVLPDMSAGVDTGTDAGISW